MFKLLNVNKIYFTNKYNINKKISYPSFEYAIIKTENKEDNDYIYKDYFTNEEYEFVYSCLKKDCDAIGKKKCLNTIIDKKYITKKRLVQILEEMNDSIKNDAKNINLLYYNLLYCGHIGKKIDDTSYSGNEKKSCFIMEKDGSYRDISNNKVYKWFYDAKVDEVCINELIPLGSISSLRDEVNKNGFIEKKLIINAMDFENKKLKLEKKKSYVKKKKITGTSKVLEFKRK